MTSKKRDVIFKAVCAVLVAAGLSFFAGTLQAQVSTAFINGTVTDSSGAAIPEASLLLRNTLTGIETRTATNSQGVYAILNILPGTYTAEASKQGFSISRLDVFSLVVNQRSVFDFQLAVGKLQGIQSVVAPSLGQDAYALNAGNGAVLPGWPFFTADSGFSGTGARAAKTGVGTASAALLQAWQVTQDWQWDVSEEEWPEPA